MTKISFFVHDLAANPIVRAAPFAHACEKLGYEVEVLGLLLSGDKIYEPYREDFDYRTVRASSSLPEVLRKASRLAEYADGDLAYAFKPLWTSLWPAILASRAGKRCPLLMDVEDHEFWLNTTIGLKRFLKGHLIDNLFDSGALRYKVLLYPLARIVPEKVTVSTRTLRGQFGGNIILHGPDVETFSPTKVAKSTCREKFNLPEQTPLALFAGRPHPYKGLETVVEALNHVTASSYHLVLAGSPDYSEFQRIQDVMGERCHMLGFVPNAEMPELLQAIDVVPVMQKANSYTRAQMPAKLLEAMAMAKSVVASPVGDLGRVLGAGTKEPRGWIVDAEDDRHLAQVLQHIANCPDERSDREIRAREFVKEKASVSAIAQRLRPILDEV